MLPVAFGIGHESRTTGSPQLNSAKTTASANATGRYVEVFIIADCTHYKNKFL